MVIVVSEEHPAVRSEAPLLIGWVVFPTSLCVYWLPLQEIDCSSLRLEGIGVGYRCHQTSKSINQNNSTYALYRVQPPVWSATAVGGRELLDLLGSPL